MESEQDRGSVAGRNLRIVDMRRRMIIVHVSRENLEFAIGIHGVEICHAVDVLR